MIAPPSREAYEDLRQGNWVAAMSELKDKGKGDSEFDFDLKAPFPNIEGLSPSVRFRAVLPGAFPLKKAEVFLADEETWRFPHMAGRNGLLCLQVGQPHLWDPCESLFKTIMEASEWLDDAANGTLLKPGDPWELPDFRTGVAQTPPPLPVWNLESPATFEAWKGRIGQHGEVIFRLHAKGKGLVPIQFKHAETGGITSPQPSPSFLDEKAVQFRGKWLVLPTLIYSSHRPPKTFSELAAMCSAVDVELWDILAGGAKLDALRNCHYLLVGAPIPNKMGEEPSELHWQPIVLPSKWLGSAKQDRGSKPKRKWLCDTLGSQTIPWGEEENVSPDRLGARGRLEDGALGKRVCVIGCGAIGSVLVDHLVRGGVRDLALFDSEVLEPGNLCRHTLAPSDVDQSKSHALAMKFRGINPGMDIRGYVATFPLPPPNGFSKEWREILEADAWVDCSAHDATFVWLSKQGRARGKRVLHLFTNPHARMLSICASGKHASCADVYRMLVDDIGKGNTPFTRADYFPKCDEIPVGAGCWNSAFPAVGTDIHALLASAIPVVATLLGSQWGSPGRAVVLRRNDLDLAQHDTGTAPLIEVAWNRQYRGGGK